MKEHKPYHKELNVNEKEKERLRQFHKSFINSPPPLLPFMRDPPESCLSHLFTIGLVIASVYVFVLLVERVDTNESRISQLQKQINVLQAKPQ